MKTLVIGNSQVGALRMAADAHARGAEFDFLSLPGGKGPKLVFDGSRVVPPKGAEMIKAHPEALASGVNLAGYGALVFSALGLSAPRAVNAQHLLNRFRVAGFATSAPEVPVVSSAFMAEMIAAALARMPATQSLRGLAARFDGPVLVQPFPVPNELLRDRDPEDTALPGDYGDALGAFQSWYYTTQWQAMSALVAGCGDHVRLLDYPEADWLAAGFTPAQFAQGRDCWHMNANYGARVLDQALEMVGETV